MSWHGSDSGKRRSYHHGNLREALIDAALRLIREKGANGFTFAEAARAAGVSPAAPYRHFRDRDALMADVAKRGFDAFTAALIKAWDGGRPTPAAALHRLGVAYLAFARSEPATYVAMFESGLCLADYPDLATASDEAFAVLRHACDMVIATMPPAQRPPALMMALHIWSLSHGVASLFGRGDKARRPLSVDPEELLEAAVLLHYQVKNGALFADLGVLLTMFMAGLAAGAWLTERVWEATVVPALADVALVSTGKFCSPLAPLSLSGRLDEFATVASAREAVVDDPAGTRVGWLGDLNGHLAMEPGIIDRCHAALGALTDLGCHVEPAVIATDLHRVWDAWLVLRHMSVTSSLAMLVDDPGKRELVKPEVLWELDQGLALGAEDVVRASTTRTTLHTAMVALFDRFDVLAIPTAQVWPFDATLHWPRQIGDRAMDTYHRWMEVTLYATFAGLPAISVPVAADERGLPMGMQLIGRPRGDADLLRLAAAYETTLQRVWP